MSQELPAVADYGPAFAISRIGLDEARAQAGTQRRIRKTIIEEMDELRGFCPMEIRNRALLLFGIGIGGRGRVHHQRKNAVEKSRTAIHGADIAIHGELAAAHAHILLRRIQQHVHQAGKSQLLPRLLCHWCCRARSSSGRLRDNF